MDEMNWNEFLLPYELAMEGFELKLEAVRKQFLLKDIYNPIEIITGRIKTADSILEKAKRLGIAQDEIASEIHDIAGIRVICKYLSDVYQVYDILASRKDLSVIEVKDYIKEPKPSGYRSLHLIALYHVETIDGPKPITIEFQIRTHAMHLWASIEHELKYKFDRNVPALVQKRLKAASVAACKLDNEMSGIRQAIIDENGEPLGPDHEEEAFQEVKRKFR